MRKAGLIGWVVAGALGAGLLAWAYPRAFPFMPRGWTVSRAEAVAIARERLNDLGDPVADPYVVTRLSSDHVLERRLQLALGRSEAEIVRRSGLGDRVLVWQVTFYPRGAQHDEWTYQVQVAPGGEVVSLLLRVDPRSPGAPLAPADARIRADAFLAAQGFDLARYGEPEVRSQQLEARTDLAVRYRDRRPTPAAPGEAAAHGVEVRFAGDRLAGFTPWLEDPRGERALQDTIQQASLAGIGGLVVLYLALSILALPFVKRYHEGEIGVRRGVQIFALVLAAGLLLLVLTARGSSQNSSFGFATREQMTWVVALFVSMFNIIPSAVLAFFAWSVGESICRERWGAKLAAFDALFKGEWGNATVAKAAFVGVAAGLLIAGLLPVAFLPLQRLGAWPLASASVASAASSAAPSLDMAASYLCGTLPALLAVVLCLVPPVVRRLGRLPGVLVALAGTAPLLYSPLLPVPPAWGLLGAALFAAGPVLLFLAYDLLAVLVAGFVAQVLLAGYPLLVAVDPGLRAHGWIAVALAAAPLAASLRHLGSGKEFVYRYEDIPPHVRRIADRERQRVELETARRIQSSILPELPPRLAGVDIAHSYLPASEVGGDFYDVLALEDGRLAVAVGDVAGHGVSSGLVMSMAKSALAVQVTFNPDVAAVFGTLNRMVYQTARKRLLTTLCYALLDPARRELLYASAGHLYPYLVSRGGRVVPLESTSYPLGVRHELRIEARTARVEPGDSIFLFSDGLVEAHPDRSDEPFGFERLESSLARHAGDGAAGLRDGVLADLARYTGNVPREDDQTILVLRLAEG